MNQPNQKKKKSIYIKFVTISPGGVGHTLTDYLTIYILAKIFNFKFINSPFIVPPVAYRGMTCQTKQNQLFWNDFLNLDSLSSTKLPENCKTITVEGRAWFGYAISDFENIIYKKITNNNNCY